MHPIVAYFIQTCTAAFAPTGITVVFYSFTYASSIQQVEKNVLFCIRLEALKVLKLLMRLAWAPFTPA